VKTLVIAEAGVNHNGDLARAYRMIEVAAGAGADLIKFQTFSAARLATPQAAKADYQVRPDAVAETQYEMLSRLELTRQDHEALMAHCRRADIGFLSTAFDIESVDMLVDLGLRQFKIPSGEITNLPYLRHVGSLGRELILSTGMTTLDEVDAALLALERAGTPRRRVTVLHCTTAYPTAMADVNLRAMVTLRDRFGVRVGYSDHSPGTEVAVAAVALGAEVIEKHFTLDRRLPGPDHQASLEPAELAGMIAGIRNIEQALGDGDKRVTSEEAKNRNVARKSLVASRTIAAGEPFSEDNLTAKRPGTGISPMRWDDVIGRRAPRAFVENELIEL
jgi:N-acetylneuraminate synthase